jgi:hypothetical protein
MGIILILLFLVNACDKGTETLQASVPQITTTNVSGIASSSAFSGGTITSDGGAAITARGVCWGTNSAPTIADNRTTDGTGSGSFTSTLTGLSPNTNYFIRAYATNSAGTGYGNTISFTTATSSSGNQLAYFGQTPPGKTFIPFAREIIGYRDHSEITFSPDGLEAYWSNRTSIVTSKVENGRWTAPSVISFSGQGTANFYDDVPVVSPDNKKLFFLSQRPIPYASPSRENIWYVERTTTGWGEPRPLPPIVNSIPGIHWQVSVANNGNLYFSATNDSARIHISRYVNGEYTQPEDLRAINNFGSVTCPFIAPDESYITFCKLVAGRGTVYISFKDTNGQWIEPKFFSQILGPTSFVTRDGKYIFECFQWASAEILEDYKPKN